MLDLSDVGRIAVALALGLTVYALAASLIAARSSAPEMALSGRNATAAAALFTTIAIATLAVAFLTRDFSIQFVAENSSRAMPAGLTVAAVWGGQAGSLLYWSWILALFTAAASFRASAADRDRGVWVTATMAAVLSVFLGLVTFSASPFKELPMTLADGRGLNPLLWDSGMQIHPPLLLAGFVSFSVPFAFAIGALVTGRIDREWIRATRGWMLLAWGLQSAGLLFGAWWAYRVLGWGGYWGWDPVENVALIPWLIATAYLHSAIVQERRGMLKLWNVSLAIAAFVLAILGTFVVRSGILTSVHSFANSDIGPVLFVFLGLVLVGSIALVAYRLPLLRPDTQFEAATSREAGFLFNNLLLITVAAATFWGTMFPLVSEIFRGAKMAVGAPFYQQVNGPLILSLVVLAGVGPLLAWRRGATRQVLLRFAWPLATAALVSILLVALGMRVGLAVLAFAACGFTAASIAYEFGRGILGYKRNRRKTLWVAARAALLSNRRRHGGYVVHLGIVLVAVGVIGSTFFSVEKSISLQPEESAIVGAYTITFERLVFGESADLDTVDALIHTSIGGSTQTALEPGRRIHRGWESQPVSAVAIRTVLPRLDDLYVLLSGWDIETGSATLRVIVNPLVSVIWIGGMVYFVGVLIVGWPGALRREVRSVAPQRAAPAAVRAGG